MAFGGLDQKAPVSADIFRLFSFLDPERIPLSLLTEGSRGLSENMELSRVIKSPLKLLLALADMRSGSLAKEVEGGKEKVFWVHDLVQYLCRQWLKPMERRKWAEHAIDLVTSAYPNSLDTLETWNKAQKYLKHGQACTEHAAALQIQTVNLGDLMIRMSWFLRQTGQLSEATRLAIRAVDCAKAFGEGRHQHMNAVSNLGLMYYTQSRLKEAHEQWINALEMGKTLLGSPGYIDTGIGNNLALLYYQEGRFDKAEEHHLQIYERRNPLLGEHHPETLGAMGSLANTYHFQGRLEKAIDLKKQIVEERTKHMGEHHPETLGAKGSLATSYSDQGLLNLAETLQQEVMVGRETQLGKQNPEYLSAKGSLSYTYYLQGLHHKARLDDAEKYQLEVRDERMKLWGEQHVETLGAMRHLAKTYYAQGCLGEAADLQEKVVFGMEQLFGKNHAGTLSAREELSTTYHDQGLLKMAEGLREVVAEGREKLWGVKNEKQQEAMEAFSRKNQGFAH
jgi:tetratricopeptide (TPR) repeat protein